MQLTSGDLHKITQDVLGRSDEKIEEIVMRGVSRKYDRKKLYDKLVKWLDEIEASKLVERVIAEVQTNGEDHKNGSRKRSQPEQSDVDDSGESKKRKVTGDDEDTPNGEESKTDAIDVNVVDVMAEARRMIEERKRLMNLTQVAKPAATVQFDGKEMVLPPEEEKDPVKRIAPSDASAYLGASLEKQKKLQELQARIAAKLPTVLETMPISRTAPEKPSSASLLESLSRSVEAAKEIQLTQRMPTLKANIRAERREQFERSLETSEQFVEEQSQASKYFDPRVRGPSAFRKKRGFAFHDKGTFEKMASRQRAKAKLEKLQADIAEKSKRTGISSVAQLALVGPQTEELLDDQVSMEWWDHMLTAKPSYDGWQRTDYSHLITNLIEHPIQLKPPVASEEVDYVKVYLTDKERKKLRRQSRREMQREKQEKVRIGLEPVPEPKVKIGNLMRVLGNEAIQDPTKMEAHVRMQMKKRAKKHEEANLARKLTPQQRKEKKAKKIKEDLSTGVHVAVYRVLDLTHPAKKFKIETNAKQLYLTGVIVLHKDINVVVVEGGPKQQRFFKKLMLQRIKWDEDQASSKSKIEQPNKCVLVWEGLTNERSFGEIRFKPCPLEKLARDHFKQHNVEHYWDLAFTGAIVEQSSEEPIL